MPRPLRFLKDPSVAPSLVELFGSRQGQTGWSYATVRDYCDSLDQIPQITGKDGDLKNVQRPWAVKAVLASRRPPARVLEIGGGEPVVSGFLSELGYDVTLIDPYDGFGNGPTDYERYTELFPHVKLVRDYFSRDMANFAPASFDVIFSVSVLEHIPPDPLRSCFAAIKEALRPGGLSIHCFDFVLQGLGQEHALENAFQIFDEQSGVESTAEADRTQLRRLLDELQADVETFFLSPLGHHHWRGGLPYDQFPFRKVVSVQTIAATPAR